MVKSCRRCHDCCAIRASFARGTTKLSSSWCGHSCRTAYTRVYCPCPLQPRKRSGPVGFNSRSFLRIHVGEGPIHLCSPSSSDRSSSSRQSAKFEVRAAAPSAPADVPGRARDPQQQRLYRSPGIRAGSQHRHQARAAHAGSMNSAMLRLHYACLCGLISAATETESCILYP